MHTWFMIELNYVLEAYYMKETGSHLARLGWPKIHYMTQKCTQFISELK